MSTPIFYGPEFSSFLRSIRLLFKYKGLEHKVSSAPYGEEITFFRKKHSEMHPFRKIPVLIEGELVLPETLAIAWYIENKPGPSFMPGDAKQQAVMLSIASMITQYVHSAIMGKLILEFRFPKGEDGKIRFDVMEEHLPQTRAVLAWLVTQLDNRLFVTGNQFTLADAYLIPMLDYLDQMPTPYNLNQKFDSLCRYLEHHREQAYSQGVLGKPE